MIFLMLIFGYKQIYCPTSPINNSYNMMFITYDNFNKKESEIVLFVQLINIITNDARFCVSGDVVRDFIVPLTDVSNDWITLENIKSILPVEINSIDILIYNNIKDGIIINNGYNGNFDENAFDLRELLKKIGWKELFVSPIQRNNRGCSIKYEHEITGSMIDINIIERKDDIKIDFDVNSLCWNKHEKFTLIYKDQTTHSIFFNDDYLMNIKIMKIINHIKLKICRIMPNLDPNKNFRRIVKMIEKNYSVINCNLKKYNHKYEIDNEDRICIICREDLYKSSRPAHEAAYSICGHNHFVHIRCLTKWYNKKDIKCMVCKIPLFIPDKDGVRFYI